MHTIIRAIVYAKTQELAMLKAKQVFNKLVEQNAFDCFETFDNPGSSVSGRGRWGNIVAITLADSEEGKQLIDEAIEAQRDQFKRHVENVKYWLDKYSAEELYEKSDEWEWDGAAEGLSHGNFNYACHCLGEDEGSNILLYDNDGAGIKNRKQLSSVLNKYDSVYEKQGKKNPFANLGIWIVPADVRF